MADKTKQENTPVTSNEPVCLCSSSMSVVLQGNSGWVLDSLSLIDRSYERCIRWTGLHKSHVKCRFNRQCFQILKSHFKQEVRTGVGGESSDVMQKTDKQPKVNCCCCRLHTLSLMSNAHLNKAAAKHIENILKHPTNVLSLTPGLMLLG